MRIKCNYFGSNIRFKKKIKMNSEDYCNNEKVNFAFSLTNKQT